MKPFAMFISGAVVLSGALALSAQTRQEESVYAELLKAPAKYQRLRNPLLADKDAPVAGGILFEEHCQGCHGKEAIGSDKAPSLRAAEVREAAPGAIFWILTNGVVRKKMPVWSKLPEPQRWQLVSYLKSLNAESKPEEAQRR